MNRYRRGHTMRMSALGHSPTCVALVGMSAFVRGVGPFPKAEGHWTVPPETLMPGERAAAASLYLALVTTECMDLTDAGGSTIVEGPFASNRTYCAALGSITGRPALPSAGTSGTSRGAALLFAPESAPRAAAYEEAPPLAISGSNNYAAAWRRHANR